MFICRKALAFRSNLIHLDSLLIRRIQNHVLQGTKSKSTNVDLENTALKPKFTQDEEEKILNTLNTLDLDQLSRFKISQGGLKNLENWRSQKGSFETLSEILEAEGLDEDEVEELCDRILSSNAKKKLNKSLKKLIIPVLTKTQIENIDTVVGLQLDPIGISWAKICQEDNELCEWSFHDFTALPKKSTPIDLFHMAVKVLNVIPMGDIYVLEAQKSLQNQKQAVVPTHTQHLEFSSMLIALINTSQRHNPSREEINTDGEVEYTNKVHYLKHYLPARLFKTLVGNERVSSAGVIKKLLDHESDQLFPCTPISVSEEQISSYYSYSPGYRHLLGQALLLTMSFMDTCVYKNPRSLNALVRSKKNKVANKPNTS